MATREEVFDDAIEEVDESALKKAVDFKAHRFVSIERDKMTMDHYAKGHKSLRGACNYLARELAEGSPFVPVSILDLDTSDRHELDVFAHVAPKSVNAVSLMMPRKVATAAAAALTAHQAYVSADEGQVIDHAVTMITGAL